MRIKGDQATTRAMNNRTILDILLRDGPVSRRDLALATGLSAGTVTTLVQGLITEGLLAECEAGQSSGGRKPIPVAIQFDARLSIGIKLSETRLEGVATNLAAEVTGSGAEELTDPSPEEVVKRVSLLVHRLIPDSRLRADKLIGIGLAMPGFVDVRRGVVSTSHRISWSDVPIAAMISRALGAPVWIDNDVNAYTIAHRRFGLARGKDSVLAIMLGTGLGAGLITGGKIFRGARFRAGEIGFARAGGGEDVTLGEQFTLPAIEARWQALGKPLALVEALAQGSGEAERFVWSMGQDIGTQIALLAQMIDPDVLVIGGETLQLGPVYRASIAKALGFPSPDGPKDLQFDLANDLWGRGAAVLAIDHFFDFENIGGHSQEGLVL